MYNSFSFNGLAGLPEKPAAGPVLQIGAPLEWRRLKDLLALSANEC